MTTAASALLRPSSNVSTTAALCRSVNDSNAFHTICFVVLHSNSRSTPGCVSAISAMASNPTETGRSLLFRSIDRQ